MFTVTPPFPTKKQLKYVVSYSVVSSKRADLRKRALLVFIKSFQIEKTDCNQILFLPPTDDLQNDAKHVIGGTYCKQNVITQIILKVKLHYNYLNARLVVFNWLTAPLKLLRDCGESSGGVGGGDVDRMDCNRVVTAGALLYLLIDINFLGERIRRKNDDELKDITHTHTHTIMNTHYI